MVFLVSCLAPSLAVSGKADRRRLGTSCERVLTANGGGVASLLSRFEAAGLGSQAQSWVSTGENLPISADQIGAAFSANEIEGWATQAGTTPDKLRGAGRGTPTRSGPCNAGRTGSRAECDPGFVIPGQPVL